MVGNPRMETEGAMKKQQGEMEREMAKEAKRAEGMAQQAKGNVQDAMGRDTAGHTNQFMGNAKQNWNQP